jgi:nitrogen PTS system EIIA component
VHTISQLMTLLGLTRTTTSLPETKHESCRHVMVHVTIDSQHATPLRKSLVRDCAGEPWTIRMTPLRDSDRVRLTLILPKTAVSSAIQHLAQTLPSAQVNGVLDVPETPSHAWRDLMDRSVHRNSKSAATRSENIEIHDSLCQLLHTDHVLLDADVRDRAAVFNCIGRFVEAWRGISAHEVASCLESRESLGSTALGEGVAVPHGQIAELHEPMVFYTRPRAPISFDAPDGKPVSDVIVLLAPECVSRTHLNLLGEVAEYFCDHRFRDYLHACHDAGAVCDLFAEHRAKRAAH